MPGVNVPRPDDIRYGPGAFMDYDDISKREAKALVKK